MAKSHPTTEKKSSAFDALKWIVAIVILAAGISANYMYVAVPASIRASIGIVVVCVVLLILGTTSQGIRARHFLQSVRVELRKVVWPTRQETVRMTIIILAIVIALSLVMWGVDTLFFALVKMITTA